MPGVAREVLPPRPGGKALVAATRRRHEPGRTELFLPPHPRGMAGVGETRHGHKPGRTAPERLRLALFVAPPPQPSPTSPKTSVIKKRTQITIDHYAIAQRCYPGQRRPIPTLPMICIKTSPPLCVRWPGGIGASGPRLQWLVLQHRQHACSRSTDRRNTPCHGLQDSSR